MVTPKRTIEVGDDDIQDVENDIEKLKELTTFSPILDVARNGTNVEVSIESK